MDFIELLKIMIRRWFVVLPVLVAAAVIGSQLVGEPVQSYTATGSELLVRADAESSSSSTAPISTSIAGSILSSALDQEGYRASLRERGLTSDYTVESNISSTVITINITDGSTEVVLATGQAMAAEAQELLASVVGAETTGVRVSVVSAPTEDDVVSFGTQNSLTIAIAVLPSSGEANPFPPSNTTVRTLLDLAQRPGVTEQVRAVAPAAGFVVAANDRDTAAIINISITSPNPADIGPAYGAVIDGLQIELDDLQSIYGVEPGEGTTFSTLAPPSQIVQTSSSELRVIAGIALLALAVACGLAILADTLIARRRAKRRRRGEEARPDNSIDSSHGDGESSDDREPVATDA